MTTSKIFYVEHLVSGERLVNFEYKVEVDSFEPYVPAKTFGPPENCYPAEGGYVELCRGDIKRRRTDVEKAPWERVPFSIFMEGMASFLGFVDDPIDMPNRKTAMNKVDDFLQEEMFEACQDEDDFDDSDLDREDPIHNDWDVL